MGVPVGAGICQCAAQRDVVPDRHIFVDDAGFPDDKPKPVIQPQPRANLRCGVDIGAERASECSLKRQRHIGVAVLPKLMRHPVGHGRVTAARKQKCCRWSAGFEIAPGSFGDVVFGLLLQRRIAAIDARDGLGDVGAFADAAQQATEQRWCIFKGT